MNVKKTKFVVISEKKVAQEIPLKVQNECLEHGDKYKYIGTIAMQQRS